MKKTGAVLVAAGLSSRMKDFKPMLPFGTSTASRHMIGMLKSLKADPIVVLLVTEQKNWRHTFQIQVYALCEIIDIGKQKCLIQ